MEKKITKKNPRVLDSTASASQGGMATHLAQTTVDCLEKQKEASMLDAVFIKYFKNNLHVGATRQSGGSHRHFQ